MVDTTFVPIRKPYLRPYYYYSPNKKEYGLLYQVTVSIGKPYRIVDFSGPYKGSGADVTIMRESLLPSLEENEKVLCDKAYLREIACITPPQGKYQTLSREGKGKFIEVTKVRQLNERVIGRIKQWGVMVKKWQLDFDFHELCARCAAKLTQLQLYITPLT